MSSTFIAAVCAGVGLAAGNNLFAALTERARRLNDRIGGHRFLFDTVSLGGSALELDTAKVTTARDELEAMVHTVVVEQLAELLGITPGQVDERYTD